MIPVSAYIPGCPASPNAIVDGVVKLLQSVGSPGKVPVSSLAPLEKMPPDEQEAEETQALTSEHK